MKGNFFATELTNSPETEIANNPLDAMAVGNKRKRKSTSLLFNQPNTPDPETQNIEQGFEDILNEVADLVEDKVVQQKETSHQREEVLLTEIKALKDNQAHLENAWKTLNDNYIILEKTLADLRSKKLVEENTQQK